MITIIQYNAGNVRSVENALIRLGCIPIITNDPEVIIQADKVIFPGVGEASSAMCFLREQGLDRVIPSLEQPVLGICLGLQLLCSFSEEGMTPCLGVFDARVRRFPPGQIVPHMGWNSSTRVNGPLFHAVAPSDDFYYVHGYYAEVGPQTIAECHYILPFSSAMHKGNFYATQFHPEKSASPGRRILQNFLDL